MLLFHVKRPKSFADVRTLGKILDGFTFSGGVFKVWAPWGSFALYDTTGRVTTQCWIAAVMHRHSDVIQSQTRVKPTSLQLVKSNLKTVLRWISQIILELYSFAGEHRAIKRGADWKISTYSEDPNLGHSQARFSAPGCGLFSRAEVSRRVTNLKQHCSINLI